MSRFKASSCCAPRSKGRWHLRQQMPEGICSKIQSAPKFAAFESLQALRASIPTPIGPSGHFPLTGGIGPLCPRGAFSACGFALGFRFSLLPAAPPQALRASVP